MPRKLAMWRKEQGSEEGSMNAVKMSITSTIQTAKNMMTLAEKRRNLEALNALQVKLDAFAEMEVRSRYYLTDPLSMFILSVFSEVLIKLCSHLWQENKQTKKLPRKFKVLHYRTRKKTKRKEMRTKI